MIYSVRAQHIRLYADQSLEFEAGVNLVIGPNASGKTTILEIISAVCSGSSYRAPDRDIVRFDAPWGRIDAQTETENRTLKFVRHGETIQKSYLIDDKPFVRLHESRTIPFVLFEPDQLQSITTQPELRRKIVDDLVEQAKPSFGNVRRQYKRCLSQRNSLLKQPHARPDDFFVWNLRLSELAGVIVRERTWVLSELNKRLPAAYSAIAGADSQVYLSYISPYPADQYESHLLQQLEVRLQTDRERGYTTRGSHLDDIQINLNDKPLQAAASRGEVRTLLLSLKTAEAVTIESARGKRPILLFDDVFGELDGRRRHQLTSLLKSYQTFITTTDADVAIEYFGKTSNVIALQ